MLACFDSSSVTVRNNEIFVKEIQDEDRGGDEPSVFTMCREFGCCPAQYTMMDHFFSHGIVPPGVQDRGYSSGDCYFGKFLEFTQYSGGFQLMSGT